MRSEEEVRRRLDLLKAKIELEKLVSQRFDNFEIDDELKGFIRDCKTLEWVLEEDDGGSGGGEE